MEEVRFLILTIAIELPIALILLRKDDWRRVALVVFGSNMVSHPIVWQMIFFQHINWFLAETGVIAFESLVYGLIFKGRRNLAIFTGISVNIVTAAIGYIFF
ncbi:hypothetical protein A2348_03655 [Candidatus Uhrbacteria bacterium RIFOXYB12_FULL_58_10]|uniref:Uncharacterized protein n=1 Tax=Candidatus Uhrbacteria bacterium RIFOXYB2_FULL_57_15 TaxID=1802422 RepID=A0A1F7W9D6_9BACT|nr:MAG: hypothetical protein A2348_03655 [Candidatus Uhrbacteria bacterium RIFOXYB12_FULL_58_10]OGL99400.1 MAG: hypothetical protein A2304_01230 [Candidatus Uhrbacteria bacterium RIFOXYB2_FULL_57_15]OGL99842.1 MAG: hypothetical protein A2501_05440 [Candidatus Uhrbacteria bacterium RIFOXYC12_FULL_57_11]